MNLTLDEAKQFGSTHKCGECGAGLLMPWVLVDRKHVHNPVCADNPTHTTFVPIDPNLRNLYNPETKKHDLEYDIMTQESTTVLAVRDLPTDITGMLSRGALAKWPQDLTPADKNALAHVALAYELDFLNGELIPYQGHPYITIKGRRRLDEVAGNRFAKAITFRPLNAEEKAWLTEGGAIAEGDLNGFAAGTMEDGTVWEGFGKVTKAEREARSQKGGPRSPVVEANPFEMFQNRSERRLRERAFGPVIRPGALAFPILEEGDEEGVIEGEVVIHDALDQVIDVLAPPKEPPPAPAPRDTDAEFEQLGGGGEPPEDYQPELPV